MQYVHDLATITYYLPGDDVVNGGRRRRGSNQEEVEKEGGRGQAAGRRLVTVKSIIIIFSVVFFLFLLEIPRKKRDACVRSLPNSDRESRCLYLRVLSEAQHKR